jgi:D-3-phosphoglycerate dehydrogenase / 2-oxoglutarate reductase
MNCLIADIMHESLFPMLADLNIDFDYLPDITRVEIQASLPDYDGIIIRSKTTIDADLLGESRRLKFIGRAGAGIDNLDVEEIEKRGILIVNAPEGNRNAVAEHTLGLLLALFNKIVQGNAQICNGIWDREGNRGYELQGRTVSLIGYGFMGMAFAGKLQSMDCRVLAYDKYKSGYSDNFCLESDMEVIYKDTDVLSLHIPLTPETSQLVTLEYLARFHKPILLLNTSRGEIVSLEAVTEALSQGMLTGAGLDVLENEKMEKLTSHQRQILTRLCNDPRVIMTPHVAGWTFESYVRINEVLCRKIASAFGLGR